jgi:hypothetical protein
MIWNSIPLMTAIDLLIIAVTVFGAVDLSVPANGHQPRKPAFG